MNRSARRARRSSVASVARVVAVTAAGVALAVALAGCTGSTGAGAGASTPSPAPVSPTSPAAPSAPTEPTPLITGMSAVDPTAPYDLDDALAWRERVEPLLPTEGVADGAALHQDDAVGRNLSSDNASIAPGTYVAYLVCRGNASYFFAVEQIDGPAILEGQCVDGVRTTTVDLPAGHLRYTLQSSGDPMDIVLRFVEQPAS